MPQTSIDTAHRKIVSRIPHEDSQPMLDRLYEREARSTHGQPPVVWDHATDFSVFDPYGNMLLDFSSGVLTANCGHSDPDVVAAIRAELDRGLLHSYCFPNQARMRLLEKLDEITPKELSRYYLLSTGSEATETCLKLAKTWARQNGDTQRGVVVSFVNSFHGRTMGAQMMGGSDAEKEWIDYQNSDFAQVPFPDDIYLKDLTFDTFVRSLRKQGLDPTHVAGVMFETYQGGIVALAPAAYVQDLRAWCSRHDVLLMFDEIQAGFGRTGRWWGFEH